MKKKSNIKTMGVKSIHYFNNDVIIENSLSENSEILFKPNYQKIDDLKILNSNTNNQTNNKVGFVNDNEKKGFMLEKDIPSSENEKVEKHINSYVSKVKFNSFIHNKLFGDLDNNFIPQIYSNFEDIRRIILNYIDHIIYSVNNKIIANKSENEVDRLSFDDIGMLPATKTYEEYGQTPEQRENMTDVVLPAFKEVLKDNNIKTGNYGNIKVDYWNIVKYAFKKSRGQEYTIKELSNDSLNYINNNINAIAAYSKKVKDYPVPNEVNLDNKYIIRLDRKNEKEKNAIKELNNHFSNEEIFKEIYRIEKEFQEKKELYNYLRIISLIRQYCVHFITFDSEEDSIKALINPSNNLIKNFKTSFIKNNEKYLLVLYEYQDFYSELLNKKNINKENNIFTEFYNYLIKDEAKNLGISVDKLQKRYVFNTNIEDDTKKAEYLNKMKVLIKFFITLELKYDKDFNNNDSSDVNSKYYYIEKLKTAKYANNEDIIKALSDKYDEFSIDDYKDEYDSLYNQSKDKIYDELYEKLNVKIDTDKLSDYVIDILGKEENNIIKKFTFDNLKVKYPKIEEEVNEYKKWDKIKNKKKKEVFENQLRDLYPDIFKHINEYNEEYEKNFKNKIKLPNISTDSKFFNLIYFVSEFLTTKDANNLFSTILTKLDSISSLLSLLNSYDSNSDIIGNEFIDYKFMLDNKEINIENICNFKDDIKILKSLRIKDNTKTSKANINDVDFNNIFNSFNDAGMSLEDFNRKIELTIESAEDDYVANNYKELVKYNALSSYKKSVNELNNKKYNKKTLFDLKDEDLKERINNYLSTLDLFKNYNGDKNYIKLVEEAVNYKKKEKPLKQYLRNSIYSSKQYQYIKDYANTRLCKYIIANEKILDYVLNDKFDTEGMKKHLYRVYLDYKKEEITKDKIDNKYNDVDINELKKALQEINLKTLSDNILKNIPEDRNLKAIIGLYFEICYIVIKGLYDVNSAYMIQIQEHEKIYKKCFGVSFNTKLLKKLELLKKFEEYEKNRNPESKSLKQIKGIIGDGKFGHEYVREETDDDEKERKALIYRRFRNTVEHSSLLANSDILKDFNEDESFTKNEFKMTSMFQLYHILIQRLLKKDSENNKDEDGNPKPYYPIGSEFEPDEKGYSTKALIIMNLPYLYNVARFNNLTIEKYYLRRFEGNVKNKKEPNSSSK